MGANWSRFHLAAKDGDTGTVVAMIDAGDSIEQITDDEYGVTALDVAAHYAQVSVIQNLLSRGAQIEQEDNNGTHLLFVLQRRDTKKLCPYCWWQGPILTMKTTMVTLH